MDKILKTLEAIKVPTLSGSDANIPGTIISAVVAASDSVKTKKKERISHCRSVTDAICLGNVQGFQDYHKILESVVEVLFQLSSDPDSDIRLVASECLNRLVRTLKDSQQPKLHMEIYKEIRRNQHARSLRTALGIFASISSHIKPQKCRAFFASLLPCFVQISNRTEEYLYENLASYFSDIFRSLGPFAQDPEIKHLCKEYAANLESTSAIIRRASASVLVSICQNSKKPHVFLPKLIHQVTGLLKPKLMEKNVSAIIGAMQCIRHAIPPLFNLINNHNSFSSSELQNVVLQLVQVYEMCVILCNHDDHNVVTTSLETLQQLLTDPVEPLKACLTSSSGIENSIDNTSLLSNPLHSQSGSLDSELESLAFPDESPELLETDNDIPKFRSFLSSSNSESREEESDVIILSRRNSDAITMEENQDVDSSSEILQHSDDEGRLKAKEVILPNFPEVQIGSLYEKNPPVYYCARFLAYNFLLAGQKGYQRPDGEVRISVKVLAINCLVNLVKISFDVYFLPLAHDLVERDDPDAQKIEDATLYATHSDPLLRGCTYVLMGCVIDGLAVQDLRSEFSCDVAQLTSVLKNGLLDSSNIGVKCAIAAVNCCLRNLWKSDKVNLAEDLFNTGLQVASNPYWLVKVDLIDLLAGVEWSMAVNSESRKKQVLNILLEYLYDEDMRVRTAAVNCIPKFVNGTSIPDLWSPERYGILCTQCIVNNINISWDKAQTECEVCHRPGPTTSTGLESVLERLIKASVTSDNKNLFAGYQAAIAYLSETHSPKLFKTAWHLTSRTSDSGMILGLYMDLLRSSTFVLDMVVHQSLLKIICNIFLASDFYDRSTGKGKSFDEGNPFWSNNTAICIHGTNFIQHIIAVLRLYQNILEQSGSTSASRKVSTSPVISPVKKFSQKLDAEKKASESEADKKAKGPYFSSSLCQFHLRKINESIMQAWRVYRCSLDKSASTKFTALLSICLDTLGRMFSVIRSDYPGMSSLIEDILSVTNAIFGICPTDILQCIRKVLESIFSSYKTENSLEIMPVSEYDCRNRFSLVMFPNQVFRFPNEDKSGPVSRSSAEVSALGAFIRQFEPAVVSGLRIYTTTSDTTVQVEVLRLLKQLISGHVNYGLVDSNQVFLGFVIKQITFLEDGQIRDASLLVEEMFQFLTLLSHEHHATKSFIDVPKILNLCDILVSSEYGSKSGIKCIMPTVLDIVVKRFKREHTNWEKKETASHGDQLLQLLTKSMNYPDEVLPAMWILLSARQQHQEPKWNDDSLAILQDALIASIEKDTLRITNISAYNCLIATLCALHNDSLPPVEDLMASLQKLLNEEVHSCKRYFSWICGVSTYWVLIVKLSLNDTNVVEGLSGSFIMKLLTKMMRSYLKVHPEFGTNLSKIFVQQFGAMVYSVVFLLRSDYHEDLKVELYSDSLLQDWLALEEQTRRLPEHETVLRLCILDLVSGINFPKAELMEKYLDRKMGACSGFTMASISIVANDLNDGDVPSVEEWIIMSHALEILKMISKPTIKTFLSRLSKYRRGQLLEKISEIISGNVLDQELEASILSYLKFVCDEFICETAVLGVELLKRLKNPYLELDVSQFVCHTLSHIHTRKLMLTHKDRDVIKSFIQRAFVNIRFPRLSMLASAVLGDSEDSQDVKLSVNMLSMVSQWCSEEITAVEGLALAKMLGSLKYTQIMNIFSQRDFNLRVLQYCFVHLRSLHLMDIVSASDVISLFTAEQRSSLMEKWALGVACVEFVVETLDGWENIISDELISELENGKRLDLEFVDKLPLMWECLAAMLRLKEAVISNAVPEEKGCYNNFIPTKIFTISFQYILVAIEKHQLNKDIPVQLLRTFLKFASAAFSDSSFVTFFNVRDNPQHIFVCVRSLQLLIKKLILLFSIDWNYNSINSDYYSEIDSECARVLIDFDYLMDFMFQVRCGKVELDNSIFELLRNVISGLGRCELVNGWVLISHLRWKPQASWKSQIFPPIEPIPLEILRSDHELLLQYIFKLNVFGVASKIQFEENWIIFLSVINLYVDESFQLQIVSAGLKALSMLLQQCVSIHFTDKPHNEDLIRLVTKIDEILDDIEPKLCKQITFPALLSTATKHISNQHSIDVNSCIRFLTDLYSQWLQNPQGKMPLLLLSEVVRSIVVLSEYFEENAQFQWMYETLMEIYKSFEKEDEVLWPHLMYGIFYSAAKIELETEQVATLAQILETSIVSPFANVALTTLKCALIYLQNHAENLTVLAVLVPYLLKLTQLDEMSKDAESHSYEVWKLLLFVWVHGPQEGFGISDFEQETLRNILTVLSPINKAYVCIRLLVLKALRKKVLSAELKSDVRKKVTKVAYETLSTPNISIFIEALKLYTTIFYADFYQFRSLPDPDPEVLMPMAERTEILYQLLKSGNKCNNQSVSRVLSLLILDFLPPSESLNRVIAEFMSPNQTAPELLAPVVAQVFEKARRKPKEAALVREWILAGFPNFINSADSARTMWSLTIFFIGVSSAPEMSTLLPFACLRRRTPQIKQLFIHSALGLYGTLDESRGQEFRSTLLRVVDVKTEVGRDFNPFSYLAWRAAQ